MTTDGAIELIVNAVMAWMRMSGPLLLAALVVGLVVGVLQAATQINEASVSFLTKLIAMGLTMLAVGPWCAKQMVEYTERTIESIAYVAR
jgi:flagellar biosynthesis protein FliQ